MENSSAPTEKILIITPEGKINLKSTVSWGSFLAGMGFVYVGFLFIFGLTLTFSTNIPSAFLGVYEQTMLNVVGIIYLVMGIVYLIPVIYLHLFCKQIRQSLQTNSQEDFDEGIWNLRRIFQFYGIVTIVALAIGLLIIPIGVISAMVATFTF